MHLWVNNEPAKVYVPPDNPKQTYKKLQSKLSKEGSIPIGIDHLPDNLMKANPILAKLNLLDVGEITKIQYTDDTIKIVEAKLTNPLIRELYENGELDMVSIVANSTVSKCPRGDYDYIVDTTDITRVDIVEKGACHECTIPLPTDSSETVVYARYAITEEEANNMAKEGLTKEDIKTIFDECIDEKLAPMQEQIDTIIKASEPPAEPNPAEGKDDDEIKKMEAEIAELKAKTATAKVENLIASGKILPADKETHVELCAREPEIFDKLMENAPVLIDLNTKKSLFARDADDDDDLTPEEENLQKVMAHFGDE